MTSSARPGREDRPDRIAQASADEAMVPPAGGGKLRIYLGIAPGVGKTYAMLRDARARRRSGTDTVVAHWERHGRPATAAQLADLEVLPARMVTYQGASFAELDVTAVLDRRPELAVADELAHANLPVSGTPDAGRTSASCWRTASTSIRPSTSPISNRWARSSPGSPACTGPSRCRTRSRGPARSRWSNLAPSALRRRLAQGLVFPKDRVDAALSSYFRFANLAALRELAQLWLDDSVPDPVTAFAAAHGISGPVNASVIVVGLEGSPADEWLIRYAAHLAALSDARLQGVHVTAIDNLDRPPKARLEKDRRLLGELGGTLREVRRPCFRADPGRPQGRRLSAGDRVAPSLALVASADRIHGGRPGAPRGRRPARPGRKRRAAGQDQRQVAPPRTRRQATPHSLSRSGIGCTRILQAGSRSRTADSLRPPPCFQLARLRCSRPSPEASRRTAVPGYSCAIPTQTTGAGRGIQRCVTYAERLRPGRWRGSPR